MAQKFRTTLLQKVKAHEKAITTMCLGQRSVFATGGEDLMLKLWSIGKQTPPVFSGPFQSPATACVFSITENEICYGTRGGTVQLFDLFHSKPIINWTSHPSAVNCIVYNPTEKESKTFLSCGDDGSIRVLSLSSRKPVQIIKAHDGPVNCISYSPDGRYVASSGVDGKVKIFDLNTFSQIKSFSQHTGSVCSVKYHPALPLLISGGTDRNTYMYDTQNLEIIETNFPHHTSKIVTAKFFSDSNMAISASDDSISLLSIINPIAQIERVPIDCSHVYDIAIISNNVLILSCDRNHAIVTRVKFDPSLFNNSKNIDSYQPKNASRGSPSPVKSNIPSSNSNDAYELFKKDRLNFIRQITERKNRFVRLNEAVSSKGLTGLLDDVQSNISHNCEMEYDILFVLSQFPENKKKDIKFEHASPIIDICTAVLKSSISKKDLAVDTVDQMTTYFGNLALSTLGMAEERGAANPAFEERKTKSENFVRSFKKCAIELNRLSKDLSSPVAQKAKKILTQWPSLLK